jgi:hypothetical protein
VPVAATRTVKIGGGRHDPRLELTLEIAHRGGAGDAAVDALVAVEWGTMLLGGGGNPAAWLEVGRERTGHDATRVASATSRLAAGNDALGIRVDTTVDHAVDAWIGPIQTVSNSEAGFELVYQGSATLLVEPLRLRPGERWSLTIVQQVTVANATSASEAANAEGGEPDDASDPAGTPIEVPAGRR